MTEVVRGQNFKVGPRYAGLDFIGEGAYGMVVYVIWDGTLQLSDWWLHACFRGQGTAVVEPRVVALALQYTLCGLLIVCAGKRQTSGPGTRWPSRRSAPLSTRRIANALCGRSKS